MQALHCKDPSFAQSLIKLANQTSQLPEQHFQTLTYIFYTLPLQSQRIEGALQFKIAPLTLCHTLKEESNVIFKNCNDEFMLLLDIESKIVSKVIRKSWKTPHNSILQCLLHTSKSFHSFLINIYLKHTQLLGRQGCQVI